MQYACQSPGVQSRPIIEPVEARWQAALGRVRAAELAAGRPWGSVTLLAVSKTFPASAVRAVYALGQRSFGENYVQEAVAKQAELADLPGIEWRLIGPLQGNKARVAASRFDWVETVDREEIAKRLSAARGGTGRPLDVLVQVNVSGEASKHGAAPGDAVVLARTIASLPWLVPRGIMGIPDPAADPAALRAQFRRLHDCFDACLDAGLPCDTLSMGMSADLELAIAEGATEVRIGSAIFGARPPAKSNR